MVTFFSLSLCGENTQYLYSLNKFQVYNRILFMRSICCDLIHYILKTYSSYKWTFVPFDEYLPISPTPQTLATTILSSVSTSSTLSLFTFFDSKYKWWLTVFFLLSFSCFTYNVFQVHLYSHNCQAFFLFLRWIIFHCVYILHFSLSIYLWTNIRLFLYLGYS